MLVYSWDGSNVQLTTLKTSRQKYGKSLKVKVTFSNGVENIVATFPVCFRKSSAAYASKCFCKWEMVKHDCSNELFRFYASRLVCPTHIYVHIFLNMYGVF